MALPNRRTRLLERVLAGPFVNKFKGSELERISDDLLAALAGNGGSAAADTESLNRKDLALKLSRRYGFDLSVMEGMTLEQLREVARVMASKKPDEEEGLDDGADDTDGIGPEMTAGEKQAVAKKYYERHRAEMNRMGMPVEKFVETWGRASSQEFRRLAKELRQPRS